jgi:hypothetical protein
MAVAFGWIVLEQSAIDDLIVYEPWLTERPWTITSVRWPTPRVTTDSRQ